MLKSNSVEVYERCKEIYYVISLVMIFIDLFIFIGMCVDLDLVQDINF